jgi:hypothetical protein
MADGMRESNLPEASELEATECPASETVAEDALGSPDHEGAGFQTDVAA